MQLQWLPRMTHSPRHPEVLPGLFGRGASKGDGPDGATRRASSTGGGRSSFEARAKRREHLRMTVVDLCRWREAITAVLLTSCISVTASSQAAAQPPSDFYKSKQIRMISGHSAGNT